MSPRKTHSWKKFVSATKNRKPVSFIGQASAILNNRGLAVDLGCGAGVDARHLAELGFKVIAVDNDPAAIQSTKTLCAEVPVKVKRMDMVKFPLPHQQVDLVIAWNSLPFLRKKFMKRILRTIQAALVPGGLFVFSLFGPDDAWAKTRKDMSFISPTELQQCLRQTSFIDLRESRREGPDVAGQIKFWHRVQGIGQKAKEKRC